MRTPPSWPNYLSKASPPYYHHLGFRISIHEFEAHKHSVHIIHGLSKSEKKNGLVEEVFMDARSVVGTRHPGLSRRDRPWISLVTKASWFRVGEGGYPGWAMRAPQALKMELIHAILVNGHSLAFWDTHQFLVSLWANPSVRPGTSENSQDSVADIAGF